MNVNPVGLIALLEAFTLGSIAGLHLYWAAGGDWLLEGAVPQRTAGNTRPAFTPSRAATLVVAGLLLLAALLVLERAGITALLSGWVAHPGVWALTLVFAARGVGDFRYAGLFKRVRGTRFAELDDRVFTPLTLGLSLASLAVALG